MVRFAKREELESVNQIRKQVSSLHSNGRPDICSKDFSKEMQDEIYSLWELDNCDVLVAIKNDSICGFASVEYIDRPSSPYMNARKYYHIKEFGVDEKFRRQKIATELFEFIKMQAKERNFEKLELDVFEFNEGAVKFYESVGFCTYRRYMEYENK